MTPAALAPGSTAGLLHGLQALFTRSYYSMAGYVFESQPYVVPEDADLLDHLSGVRREDRRHARLLAELIGSFDTVPQPHAFPYWHRDLNYLSVPWLAGFVVETLEEDLRLYDAVLADWPESLPAGRAILESIRREKDRQARTLKPLAREARAREARVTKERIDARRKEFRDREAKEKAAKAAATKKPAPGAPAPAAAAPAAGAKLTPKERARLAVQAARGQAPGAPAPAAAAAVDVSSLPDPNEPGITPKEKARRQMLRMRAAQGAPAPAAAAPAAPAPAAADLPDPNEPGITPKEKARRQMMRMRAQKAGASPSPAAAPAPAPAAAAEPDLDPDEPGITPKEKARRQVLRLRGQKRA